MTEHRITIAPGHRKTIRVGSASKWISDPLLTVAPGDSVIINQAATPTPDPVPDPTPDPAPTGGLYIAPNGNDANPGTITSPMKTIIAASARLAPGQTLWVRGGTYTGQGGYNWKSSGTSSAPVTIRAYPGETPIFDGSGQSHGTIVSAFHDVVIDGLQFNGFGMGPSGDGSILLLNAQRVTIQNCRITNSGSGFQQDHHIYVNSGCADVVIRGNYMQTTPGAAVHLYHDPGPTNVLIENNDMLNGYWGVVIGSNANGVRVNGNRFDGNQINIDNQRGTSVTVDGVSLATGARR